MPQHQPPESEEEEDDDADLYVDRVRRNCHCMRGNHNHGNNDPFAKTKFTMIPCAGTVDPEVYLD
jgi:hypothetical protein